MESSEENIKNKELVKSNKSEFILYSVKSKYILIKIFDYLQKNKNLAIIKYNKELQNIFNISIKDYKEYCDLFSPIEIELVTQENKYGKFINIVNEEDKKYFHIYFNNNNSEEIKRYKLNNNDKIRTIKIIIDYQITSLYCLFAMSNVIEAIKRNNFFKL